MIRVSLFLFSEFTSRCSINKSLLSSQQFDSDLDLISSSPPLTPSPQLKPGLDTKPPPGLQQPQVEEDIVDLKFRNWFPNSLKYANELPAFIPDSRISTNDIPTTCRSAANVKSSLVKQRHAKSDNFLNRIGYKNTERYARTEGGEDMTEEEDGENSRNDRRENNAQRRQFHNHHDEKYEALLTQQRVSETFPKRGETCRTACGLHVNYSDQTDNAAMSSDNQDQTKQSETSIKDTQGQSNQQIIRYNTCRENSQHCNYNGNSHNGTGISDTTRNYGYYKEQESDNNQNAEKEHKGNNMYNYGQHNENNGYNQHRDFPRRGYNREGIGTIHEDIGATSNEYFIEYKAEKMNEDSQQEHNQRYAHNQDANEIFKTELKKGHSYEKEEYQEYWRRLTENSHNTNNICSKTHVNIREQTTPDGLRGGHFETSETHGYRHNEFYSREHDNKARCDSCTRTKYESSKIYDHSCDQGYARKCLDLKENVNETSDSLRHGSSNKEGLQNNGDTPNETDSARSEETHYTKSMDVMDKIYSSKNKERHRHGKEKQPKFIDDTRTEYENGFVHKNVKRKSIEFLKSRISKSLSEDTLTRGNEISNGMHLEHNNVPGAQYVNSRVNHENNMNTNSQIETQDVSHYLERYDFEQDERILNHILEKAKHKPIPEIKVTDASMMSKEDFPVKDINSSTYNEIVDILKVLENEEKGLKINSNSSPTCERSQHTQGQAQKNERYSYEQNTALSSKQTTAQKNHAIASVKTDENLQPQDGGSTLSNGTIQVRDIYSFLDQVDNQVTVSNNITSGTQAGGTSKLSELMKLSSADLAQKYLTLSINMDEKQIIITALEKRIEQIDKHCKEMKTDTDATVKRLQKFVAQLIKEKKDLSEQCAEMCKDMDKKYKQIIETMEERHKIEIRKNTDKHLAAEKIRREKWIDNKTQKIKELTVKGLEPELLKMTNAHQEEIAEMRKAHNRQIEENDGIWNRKITNMKEKFEEDLQNAILQEKENNRKRLDEEIKTMENNYQQQRQHLLNEIRIERENLDRQAEDMRNEKEKELNQKLEKMAKQNKEVCERLENKHQYDIKKLKEELNQEKQMWIETKTAQNEEKEQLIREQCKRERDKHIELIIQKLEKEQTERNNAADAKMKNMKEQNEKDVEELESTLNNIKSKLNETRTKLQDSEDQVTELKAQVHGFQIENKNQGELLAKLRTENHNLKLKSEHETNDKINRLEEEVEQTRSYFETLVDRMKKDQERELSLVYGRVKETISKKDEAISLLTQQKQAALTQCASLEAILTQRKH